MTTRERKERRLELRQEWAAKRAAKAQAKFGAANRALDGIPFGQPILVGHHSEKRHRRTLARADSHMRSGIESEDMAANHTSKAGGIQHQLDTSIYSDDTDAIEALRERIGKLEAKRERMKRVNALFRKGDAAGLAELGLDLDKLRIQVAAVGYSWVKAPYERWQLANLGQRIAADRKRIKTIEDAQARQAKCEAAGGIIIERFKESASIQFEEKPEREILNALREAGFYWSGGRWNGHIAKIPAAVLEMAQLAEAPAPI